MTNLAKGEGGKQLTIAVNDWLKNTGVSIGENGKKLKLKDFVSLVCIPYNTLSKYVCKDQKSVKKIGHGQGPTPLLGNKDQEYIADVL